MQHGFARPRRCAIGPRVPVCAIRQREPPVLHSHWRFCPKKQHQHSAEAALSQNTQALVEEFARGQRKGTEQSSRSSTGRAQSMRWGSSTSSRNSTSAAKRLRWRRSKGFNPQITSLIHSTPDYAIRFTIEVWKELTHKNSLSYNQVVGQHTHQTSCVCWTSDPMDRGGLSMYVCKLDGDNAQFEVGMEIAKVMLTPSPVWCVGWCLSRTNPMHILARNQVYHHTPTRKICHYTNRDDLWKTCEPLCTRSETLFDTPLRRKLRTSTSLILLRRSVFECMYIIMYFCTDVGYDLDIIWSKTF